MATLNSFSTLSTLVLLASETAKDGVWWTKIIIFFVVVVVLKKTKLSIAKARAIKSVQSFSPTNGQSLWPLEKHNNSNPLVLVMLGLPIREFCMHTSFLYPLDIVNDIGYKGP